MKSTLVLREDEPFTELREELPVTLSEFHSGPSRCGWGRAPC